MAGQSAELVGFGSGAWMTTKAPTPAERHAGQLDLWFYDDSSVEARIYYNGEVVNTGRGAWRRLGSGERSISFSVASPARWMFNGVTKGRLIHGTWKIPARGSAGKWQLSDPLTFTLGDAVVTPDIPVTASTYVDPARGDDATALRADPVFRFRTLAAALSNAVSGDTIICLPGSNRVRSRFIDAEGPPELNLINKSNIIISAQPPRAFTIVATNMGDVFMVLNAPNCLLEGITVQGFRTKASAVTPVSPWDIWTTVRVSGGCDGTVFRNWRIDNSMNHGIAVFGGDSTTSTNITVEWCHFSRLGYLMRKNDGHADTRFDGAAVVPDEGWIVQNNTIEECSLGIEPFPYRAGSGLRGPAIVIRNNTLRNCLAGIGTSARDYYAEVLNNIIVTETNYVRKFDGSGVNPWVPTIIHTGAGILSVGSAAGLNIQRNYVSGYDIGILFSIATMTNVTIKDNHITSVRRNGLMVGVDGLPNYFHNFRIVGNMIDTTGDRGIHLASLRDSFISDNIITGAGVLGSPTCGLSLYGEAGAWPSNNVVTRNVLMGGKLWYGYAFHGGAENTLVANNVTNLAHFRKAPYYTANSTNTTVVDCPGDQ